MFQFTGKEVYITPGDTASFQFHFWGEPPEDGTLVRFSVKKDAGRMRAVIEHDYEVQNGFITICLESKDTAHLPFGDYVWDLRILWDIEDYNTPLKPMPFHIVEVVGNV